MTGLPADYAGRVYAGVLGKIIGVCHSEKSSDGKMHVEPIKI